MRAFHPGAVHCGAPSGIHLGPPVGCEPPKRVLRAAKGPRQTPRPRRARQRSNPVKRPRAPHLSAVCTKRGPRKLPPMPTATTLVRGLPVEPTHLPPRT
jgi:hypothetical protein